MPIVAPPIHHSQFTTTPNQNQKTPHPEPSPPAPPAQAHSPQPPGPSGCPSSPRPFTIHNSPLPQIKIKKLHTRSHHRQRLPHRHIVPNRQARQDAHRRPAHSPFTIHHYPKSKSKNSTPGAITASACRTGT